MDKKTSLMAILLIVLILLTVTLVFTKAPSSQQTGSTSSSVSKEDAKTQTSNVNNSSQDKSETSDSSSVQNTKNETTDNVPSSNFAILDKLSQAFPATKFSDQKDDSFEWRVDDSSSKPVHGKSIEAANVAGKLSLDSFFKKEGFEQSSNNIADGVTESYEGFQSNEVVCLVDSKVTDQTKENPAYSIKIFCAQNPFAK